MKLAINLPIIHKKFNKGSWRIYEYSRYNEQEKRASSLGRAGRAPRTADERALISADMIAVQTAGEKHALFILPPHNNGVQKDFSKSFNT